MEKITLKRGVSKFQSIDRKSTTPSSPKIIFKFKNIIYICLFVTMGALVAQRDDFSALLKDL